MFWKFLKRRKRLDSPLDRRLWVISEEDKELIRLTDDHSQERSNWTPLRPEFVGITQREFEDARHRDPRDVPWMIKEPGSDKALPYCRYDLGWNAATGVVSLKYIGCYQTSPPGEPHRVVPQERAPFQWGSAVDKEAIEAALDLGDRPGATNALSDLSSASFVQAAWAHAILLRYISHGDTMFRLFAISSIGELARVHGYGDPSQSIPKLTANLTDQSRGIRAAAAGAIDEIHRFAPDSE